MSTTLTEPTRVTFTSVARSRPDGIPNPSCSETEESLDWTTIAELCPAQIARMTREELTRVVRASGLPFLLPEIGLHLECCDQKTLERLVYLARRLCRNRTTYQAAIQEGVSENGHGQLTSVGHGAADV